MTQAIMNNDPVISTSKRFLSIEETADQTGLSVYFLRQGIKTGKIPYIRCGNKAMINLPKLIAILDDESSSHQISE